MSVKEIAVHSFRNHDQARLKFGPGVNVIWGGNGSGKTSILEAIYLLAYGRSFRTNRLLETLQIGCDKMNIAGIFEQGKEQNHIQLNQLHDGRKRFILNEKPISGARELIGLNPVVVLSPEEQIITKGAPGNRRSYFDRVFSVVSKAYVDTLVSYTRTLKQRNAALVRVATNNAPVSMITAWDDTLATNGNKIWRARIQYINEFSGLLEEVAHDFTVDDLKLCLQLTPDTAITVDEHKNILEQSLKNDIRRGYTGSGPHRDIYEIGFNGEDLRKFGSQGEHKITMVLIKMAEARFIRKHTGKRPTIILDDLFAKLDFQRSDQVLSALGKDLQTIITATDIIDLEKKGVNPSGSNDTSYHLGLN